MKKTRKPGAGRRLKFKEPSTGLWIRVPARGKEAIKLLIIGTIDEWLKNNTFNQ